MHSNSSLSTPMIARIPDRQYSNSPMRNPLSGLLYPLPPTYASCLPDVIYVIGVPRFSLFFTALLLLPCIECKPMNKNGGGLGTRLVASVLFTWEALTAYDKCFGQNDKTLHAGVGKC